MPDGSPPPCGRSAIADAEDLAGTLSPLARLALAYAPAAARGDWLTLLALDARLAGVVRDAREPMLAQLKLAWWRDRLSADPAGWPKGEPLLARLAGWRDPQELVPLVDGWEAMLGDPPLTDAAVAECAEGRGAAMTALAWQLGVKPDGAEAAGRVWAFADLALWRDVPAVLADGASAGDDRPVRLARTLRPLAVLAGAARYALARGGASALYRPGTYLTAVRIGLIGR